jgi:hypothetical protein
VFDGSALFQTGYAAYVVARWIPSLCVSLASTVTRSIAHAQRAAAHAASRPDCFRRRRCH